MQVESPDGELITTNNSQSTFVTVRKGGVKVLYLAGTSEIGGGPTIEPRFVRTALGAHADLNVEFELINYRMLQADYRDRLRDGKYDVILLGDLDASGLSGTTWRTLAQLVERGTGLGMLGGIHSFGPGGFRSTALHRVLPIQIGPAERQNFGQALRRDMHLLERLRMLPVVRQGAPHPILEVTDPAQNQQLWQQLPELDGANRFSRFQLKSNALVVAEADDKDRSPVLVLGAWGDGRTAALAVDSTWHWQMGGRRDVLLRFWRQFVLWLAKKDGPRDQQVQIALDQRRFQQGSRVEFSVTATDSQGEPLPTPLWDVQIETPNGVSVPVDTTPLGDQYNGVFADTQLPGDYRVTASVRADGESVGTATARFSISDQDVELDQPAAEPTLMANLANRTSDIGGGAFAPEELSDALEGLLARGEETREELVEQVALWDRWPTLVVLVATMSLEWLLRKRWGLV